MKIADFRSDTVTKPTPNMRRAMVEAEVGDDVYGEDPTLAKLEARVAGLLDFPAALFVPTGSMGNQIALHLHAPRGSEVILEAKGHAFHYEMSAMASLSGLMPRPVASARGIPSAADVAPWIRPDVSYMARTAAIVLENTHNFAGGTVARREHVDPILELARARGLKVHLDGARLWNAAAALGVSEASLAAGFDSVMVCFSKGLRAPVGSALLGSVAFIHEARRVRKMFGGGMRQAGVLGAAALVALDEERARLVEDHARAKRLADRLAEIPGLCIDAATVETNIVIVGVDVDRFGPAPTLVAKLGSAGVKINAAGPCSVRLVTHADVDDTDVEHCVTAFRGLAG